MAESTRITETMMKLRIRLALLAVGVAACSHTEPFETTGPSRTEGPAVPGNPAVLTRNPLQDLYPTWLPDGSAILYTFESSPVDNRDRCLGLLPPGGGTRLGAVCNISAGHLDSTEAYGPSAVSPAGRLAYRYAQSIPRRENPDVEELRVATLADPQGYQVVATFPSNVGGIKIDGLGTLVWLSETRLAFLGLKVQYASPTRGAPRDTLIDGLAVLVVDVADPASVALVPGTTNATSVAATEGIEAITYTLAGDSRVYRQSVASGAGAITTLHDFGALGIARDAVRVGDELVAVVGGAVTFFIDPVLGVRQPDLGGNLFTVDLVTGVTRQLASGASYFFRRPARSPTGVIAVEGYLDTGGLISSVADLLLVGPTP